MGAGSSRRAALRDIRQVMHHFAQQDLLALDDADRLWGLPQAQQAFSELLQERQARGRRTLLRPRCTRPHPTTHNRCALLAEQVAVRLW